MAAWKESKNVVEPLPGEWRDRVIAILSKGPHASVRWTRRAQQDWQQFGLTYQALELLVGTLRQPELWGERVTGMLPLPAAPPDAGEQVVYGFLCPHPLRMPTNLYAKLGLFADKVTIDLFSLHIDLTGDLAARIAKARKKRK